MDPYMTTNRLTYVPFTIDQQDGISRKDIITFYDASGFPRGVFEEAVIVFSLIYIYNYRSRVKAMARKLAPRSNLYLELKLGS